MSGLLASAAVLGFAVNASAASVSVDDATGQVSSEATIKVNAGEEVPTPPEEPNEPDGETGQNGPLSIDNVIVFAFEDMSLSGTSQSIPLKTKTKQNVQVTDTRGTGAGWNLQIKQTPLVDPSAPNKVLKGAYITFQNGAVVAGRDNVNPELAPTADDYAATATNKGEFQKLMTAAAGNGLGTWKLFFNEDANEEDIQLVVPSGNLVGDYAGEVIWALSDGPTTQPAN